MDTHTTVHFMGERIINLQPTYILECIHLTLALLHFYEASSLALGAESA